MQMCFLSFGWNGPASPEQRLTHLRDLLHGYGVAAPAVYVLFVTVEVVIAPLPGTLLYAPGGVIFGGFWGGFLAWLGNCLGAVFACQIVRVFRHRLRPSFLAQTTIARLESQLVQHGAKVIFLLRLNPLTSSDLVSYAVGLTEVPLWKLLLGTALGMAPLCWIQAYAADQFLRWYPELLWPLLCLCFIYVGVALWMIIRLAARPVADDTA